MTSPPSLTDRLRSSSTSNSISGITTASSSRSATPTRQHQARTISYRPRYHSRSLSSNPQSPSGSVKPIVLPFPDLPVRPISRDGSRAGSPTGPRTPMSSPGWTPRGSSTNLVETARQASGLGSAQAGGSGAGGVAMTSGRSMDGSSREGRSILIRSNAHSQSTSPTFASPLASSSTPHLGLPTSSFRPRALTSPAPVDIPRSTTHSASPPHMPNSAHASTSTSYTSPSSTPAQHASPPTASGSGSRSASAHPSRLSSFPSTSHAHFESHGAPPTPEKDHPRSGSKPSKQLSTGSTATVRPPSGFVPITPAQPIQPLQEHLYRSFLSGECADVRLWVRNWGVGWLVHKMVLVQAGFFHSLFLGGFSETGMTAKLSSRKGKERATAEDDDWSGEDVELRFDDPNITQEAFEICLSRLYSPHPRLVFPSALLPSPSHPLTPSYPSLVPSPISAPASPTPTLLLARASPELLLSLLATTIYLGHAPLMREVTAIILRTVGPGTIGRYLGFALGEGCGMASGPSKGVEGVARALPRSMCREEQAEAAGPGDAESLAEREDDSADYSQAATHRDSTTSTDSRADEDVKVGSIPLSSHMPTHVSSASSSAPAGVQRTTSNASTIRAPSIRLGMSQPQTGSTPAASDPGNASLLSLDPSSMPHFYGFASDKIGEACACWLARWGMDILSAEITLENTAAGVQGEEGHRIFRHRGIPATFLRGLLSSDSLWVKGEMQRYEATREVLEMRRKGWEAEWEAAHGEEEMEDEEEEGWEEWDEDEEQLAKVFAEGIYYSHMSFEDLSIIANDIDPTTNLPYAPLSVLQAAHWTAADLKSRIIAADPTSTEQTDEAELGLSVTSAELAEAAKRSMRRVTPRGRLVSPGSGTMSLKGQGSRSETSSPADSGTFSRRNISAASLTLGPGSTSGETVYHPIPVDNTHQSGAGGLLFLATSATASAPVPNVSGMPDLGPTAKSADDEGSSTRKNTQPAGESSWFGLKNGSRTSTEIISSLAPPLSSPFFHPPSAASASSRWTPTQPFRFSVEFWDVDTLPEKERLYSTTHFHAGSWWNVYVQTIRKKEKNTTQLGVYLHRQSLKEGVPRASRPADRQRGKAIAGEGESGPDVLEARGTRVEVRRERRSEGDATAVLAQRGRGTGSMGDVLGATPPGMSTSMGRGAGSAGAASLPGGPGVESESDMVGEETYKDARRVTRAYFSISCASALGTALVRFSSAPDSFTLSQSWGWKSSALRSEEYLAVAPVPVGDEGVLGWAGEMSISDEVGAKGRGSLRATVVVGVL